MTTTIAESEVAIVFLCYYLDDGIRARLGRLARQAAKCGDIFLFMDRSANRVTLADQPPGVEVGTFDSMKWSDIKRATRYHPTFVPGNTDYQFVAFRQQYPRYRYYWFIEYDVEFSGDWSHFFSHFSRAEEDLIATTLSHYREVPGWNLWKSLQAPAGMDFEEESLIRAFLPIARFSAQAVDAWRACALAGWTGHAEVAVPTCLAMAGMTLRDIGGSGSYTRPEDVNRFYRNTPSNNDLTPGTFVFRPSMTQPADEQGMLWHPVKSPSSSAWDSPGPSMAGHWLTRNLTGVVRGLKRRLRSAGES